MSASHDPIRGSHLAMLPQDAPVAFLVIWKGNLGTDIEHVEITCNPPPSGIPVLGKGTPYRMFGIQAPTRRDAIAKLRKAMATITVVEE